jgi:antirestriction protein ArdC
VSTITKIKEALLNILSCFESGDIPQAIAYSVFPPIDVPASHWSFLNRILVYLSGTSDARGFRQWKQTNRHVKKGATAIYILVPRFIEIEKEDNAEDEKKLLAGFMAKPVFRMEDTEGDPLDYEQIELPDLKLIERAKEWSISVKAIPGNYRFYGYYSKAAKEIALASKEETVFFHELAHAAHSRIINDFNNSQTWRKEVVAELSATVLCKMVGKTSKYLGNNYRYIEHYAKKAKLKPVQACFKVMSDVEKVLNLILQDSGEERLT